MLEFCEVNKTFHRIPLLTSFPEQSDLRPSAEKIRDYFATVWEINSETLRLVMISNGLGVTFVGSQLFEEEAISQGLAIIERSPFSTIERTVGIYYKKGTDLSLGAKSSFKSAKRHGKMLLANDCLNTVDRLSHAFAVAP